MVFFIPVVLFDPKKGRNKVSNIFYHPFFFLHCFCSAVRNITNFSSVDLGRSKHLKECQVMVSCAMQRIAELL